MSFLYRSACLLSGLLLTAGAVGLPRFSGQHTSLLPPRVVKVENGGLLFTDNSAGVSGIDAGYSLPLDKQTLWLFGDVFLLDPTSPAKPYVGGVSNCALLVPRGTGSGPLRRYTFLTDPKTGLARPVMPNAAGEGTNIRLWPLGGWHDARQQRAYLFYSRVKTTGGGPLDFRLEGIGLASANTSVPSRLLFNRLKTPERQELWWKEDAGSPTFGHAVITNAPGDYLYVVGLQEREQHKRGKLARVLKSRIADQNAYEYFAGQTSSPRWSPHPREAADVEGLHDFPGELSVAWNAYLGGYLAVHSVGLTEKVRLSLAASPWGPYRTIAEIGTPHRAFERAFCYAGKEHPELAEEGGRILYITYVDNQRYWLQLLKVTLEKGPDTGRLKGDTGL